MYDGSPLAKKPANVGLEDLDSALAGFQVSGPRVSQGPADSFARAQRGSKISAPNILNVTGAKKPGPISINVSVDSSSLVQPVLNRPRSNARYTLGRERRSCSELEEVLITAVSGFV